MEKSESHKKIDKFLEDENLTWHAIYNWVSEKGDVIISQAEYDNLEVIDENGAVP